MMSTGEPDATETGTSGSGRGRRKGANTATSPATYFTARWVRRKAARKRPTPDHRERDLAAQPILLAFELV